ncbi:unnamed protein product [Camellia sinensis]
MFVIDSSLQISLAAAKPPSAPSCVRPSSPPLSSQLPNSTIPPNRNLSLSLSLPLLLFFLLMTPFQAQLIHSHNYEAFQFRSSTQSFEAKTLNVVNIGPVFRSHYGDFSPNSLFSTLGYELRGLNSMVEDGKGEIEILEGMSRVSNE